MPRYYSESDAESFDLARATRMNALAFDAQAGIELRVEYRRNWSIRYAFSAAAIA